MSIERNIASRGWHVYGKTNMQQKSIHIQLLGQLKEKINLFLLLLGISQERFRGLQNYDGRIQAKVFSPHYKLSPIPSGGTEIPLGVKFSISEEKSVILKHLQNLIDLNYEELTSMDRLQNGVIAEEELGQDYNPKDEDIVFIDDGSESDSDYDT